MSADLGSTERNTAIPNLSSTTEIPNIQQRQSENIVPHPGHSQDKEISLQSRGNGQTEQISSVRGYSGSTVQNNTGHLPVSAFSLHGLNPQSSKPQGGVLGSPSSSRTLPRIQRPPELNETATNHTSLVQNSQTASIPQSLAPTTVPRSTSNPQNTIQSCSSSSLLLTPLNVSLPVMPVKTTTNPSCHQPHLSQDIAIIQDYSRHPKPGGE